MNNAATSSVPPSSYAQAPEKGYRLSERPPLLISARIQSWRKLKDKAVRMLIAIGGLSVIVAASLVFAYLLYEVWPLFKKPSLKPVQSLLVSPHSQPLAFLTDERMQVGAVIGVSGQVQFWSLQTEVNQSNKLLAEQSFPAQQVAMDFDHNHRLAFYYQGFLQLKDIVFNNEYDAAGVLQVRPEIIDLYADARLAFADPAVTLLRLSVRDSATNLWVIGQINTHQLMARSWKKQVSPFNEQETLVADTALSLTSTLDDIQNLLISADNRWLYVISATQGMEIFDLKSKSVQFYARVAVPTGRITASQLLLGGFSVLLGNEQGQIQQWMPVRDDTNQYKFEQVREFSLAKQPITELRPESRRKGFMAADVAGNVGYFNATAEVELFKQSLHQGPIQLMALTPRGDQLWLLDNQHMQSYAIDNEHPEVSWTSLWSKIWYEGYDKAQYLWQSSSSANDFEPKFSLMPLAFGTLKAAFYTMLLAMPLAICGAIFTAYFMAPSLRTKVKPAIELMAALPTVILGFLAGLWLAPLVEQQLPGIILLMVLTPMLILVMAYLYSLLPAKLRRKIPEGWQPLLLIPGIVLCVVVCMQLSDFMQVAFFGGDMRHWLTEDLGIDFDQRNSLVVAIAMGFAAIPVIFSIAEDAVFAVPKHLTFGSLALGATAWQTLVRVVLPTASPGIFSAVMIGFGRVVGETMIVLMATGNTPIMDANIFEGFRTLAANIAVEMPETEVGSSHFRVLFLAALVLLSFTFVLNTSAEFVRQRLREKYGSL